MLVFPYCAGNKDVNVPASRRNIRVISARWSSHVISVYRGVSAIPSCQSIHAASARWRIRVISTRWSMRTKSACRGGCVIPSCRRVHAASTRWRIHSMSACRGICVASDAYLMTAKLRSISPNVHCFSAPLSMHRYHAHACILRMH